MERRRLQTGLLDHCSLRVGSLQHLKNIGSRRMSQSSTILIHRLDLKHHCAVLLNEDFFERDYTRTPLQVPCSLRYSWPSKAWWSLKNPDPSCSYFTVCNIHVNSECTKRRSVCTAVLLVVCDMSLKFGAVVLSGDVNKAVEREALSGDSGDRRVSSLEAANSYACVPWPTSGLTPLWGPGGEPHGEVWPECCGLVLLPKSPIQWLIVRRGSFDVEPATVGPKPTDQTWHY